MKKNIQRTSSILFKEFIYGGHFQSLGAAGIAYVASSILNIQFTWVCFVVVYMIFYPLYLFNRYKEIDLDEATNPDRTHHFRGYVNLMPTILWGVILVVMAIVSIQSNFITLGFTLVLLVFGLLYTVIFKKVTKNIIIFKNLYVSAFFSSLVFFPILYFQEPLDNYLWLRATNLLVFVYIKAFVMQVFLDIKDIESDRKEKLLTIPVLVGKEKTVHFLPIFDLGISLLFSIVFVPMIGTLGWIFALVAPTLVFCYKLVKRNNYYGYVLRSGEFLSWGIVMFLIKLV